MAAPIVAFAAKTAAKWAISAIAADVLVNKTKPYWKPLAAISTSAALVKFPTIVKNAVQNSISSVSRIPRQFNPFTENTSPSLGFIRPAGLITAGILGLAAISAGAGLALPLLAVAGASFVAGNILASKAAAVEKQFSTSPNTTGENKQSDSRRREELSYDQKLSLALQRNIKPISQKQEVKVNRGYKI